MTIETKLTKDEDGESVDNTKYRDMIGSLLYLTESRPGIMFNGCICARFQEDHKSSHLEAIKRIFRYIKTLRIMVSQRNSLKALDEGYFSKNYVRKFLRALHPKWRAKKDSEIVKGKGERKSLTLKAKKESSNKENLTFGSEDEEYAMAVRDFKKFFKRRSRECPKPLRDKNQRTFVGGSWSDSGEEDDDKAKDETCLMAQASSEICLGINLEPDE
ncbi:hypothetical protein Tco_1186151 [Tanacetum coccineum]